MKLPPVSEPAADLILVVVALIIISAGTLFSMSFVQLKAVERGSRRWYDYSPFVGVAVGWLLSLFSMAVFIRYTPIGPDVSFGVSPIAFAVAWWFWAKSHDSFRKSRELYDEYPESWTDRIGGS